MDADWTRLADVVVMTLFGPQIQYPPFRKVFYIEVPEVTRMGEAQVQELRKELDGIKVRLTWLSVIHAIVVWRLTAPRSP